MTTEYYLKALKEIKDYSKKNGIDLSPQIVDRILQEIGIDRRAELKTIEKTTEEEVDMATEKQKETLQKFKYDGNVESLTKEQARSLIGNKITELNENKHKHGK